MIDVIDGFRWCILGEESPLSSRFWIVAVTAFLLGFGIRRFRKMETSFAGII
jgi:lipopolysaccharide transport system permease protein